MSGESQAARPQHRAVIFDLGGVILDSPLHAIARFERDCGIEAGFVNAVVVRTGRSGAWGRLECGELTMEEFFEAFEADCAGAGVRLSARALMERIGESSAPRPQMLEAVRRIRAHGLRAAALTNNWVSEENGTNGLKPHFDVFVESSVVGWQKPDPRIYRHTCDAVGVAPAEAVFLDDIGRNLKAARALGMTTIKVDEPVAALRELAEILGLALLE